MLARVFAIPPSVAGAHQCQVHIGPVEHDLADESIVAIALVPSDADRFAPDACRELLLGFGAEGLFAFGGIDPGQADPMRVLICIKHLDGIAVENVDDLSEEGVGIGWREEREVQDKEGREQTQKRKRHDVPRTADMGTMKPRPVCDGNR